MVIVAGPSSVISKAFAPVSGPIPTTQVSKPLFGEHITHVPLVVNWPVPEALPVNVMSNESALARPEDAKKKTRKRRKRVMKRTIFISRNGENLVGGNLAG
jgi:hypothetical protein